MLIYLYGPPGSGKSSAGTQLAKNLDLPFYDLDTVIETRTGKGIPEIFADEGEDSFRYIEKAALCELAALKGGVIALGGGALLDPENRKLASDSGNIVCLFSPLQVLMKRLGQSEVERPLLNASLATQLQELLAGRSEHYNSFEKQVSSDAPLNEIAWRVQVKLGIFRLSGMDKPYDVVVKPNIINEIGYALRQRGLRGPVALVTDRNVEKHYARIVEESLNDHDFPVQRLVLEAGESIKTISTVEHIWSGLIDGGFERRSTIVALGGGVVGDTAGFAAATFLRGVSWVILPTTVLSMVDASLGGKTGVNTPQGKNLIGAFHDPSLVLADPRVLETLSQEEYSNGLAEVVKAAVIGDAELFRLFAQGWVFNEETQAEFLRRAMAVKIKIIEEDPYENGMRTVLNFGHTIGHALEKAAKFQVSHGQAVGMGMIAEAHLAELLNLAKAGLADQIEQALASLGLPTRIPDRLDIDEILKTMFFDKKRSFGTLRFALPRSLGDVITDVEVKDLELVKRVIERIR